MSIFTTAKKNEVFYKVAKWEGENTHMFIHAPFDRVMISGHSYTMPRPFAGGQSGGTAYHLINGTNVVDELESKGDRDMFYTELNPLVIQEHQLGDYNGRPDDWTGVFAMNLI